MDSEKFLQLIRNSSDLPENLKFLKDDDLDVYEIGDGHINDVIRIESKENPEKSVVLKYAPCYIKVLGPDYPLGTVRNYREYRALSAFHKFCPGSVPRPLYCNKKEHYAIIEDLKGYTDLTDGLIDCVFEPRAALCIADSLLKIQTNSHKCNLPPEEFSKMVDEFRNPDMINVTDQFVFERPFKEGDPTNRYTDEIKEHLHLIRGNEKLLQNVKELQETFRYQKECLVHGDFHTGSIMTKGQKAKIVDPEFTFVGPAALDIGWLLAHYTLSFYGHYYYPREDALDFHETVKKAALNTIKHYFDGMSSWMHTDQLEALIKETTGFIGCELLRRLVGITRVIELNGRPLAQVACLRLGVELILKHKEVKTGSAMASALRLDDPPHQTTTVDETQN